MCLIDDDQVPLGVFQFFLIVFVAGELIESTDELVAFIKVVTAGTLFLFLPTEDIKLDTELFQQFVLPLFGQGAGGDNQYALGIGSHQQFPNQQTSHNGFTRTRIIRQNITKRLAGQHGLINGGNLVRQWFYV